MQIHLFLTMKPIVLAACLIAAVLGSTTQGPIDPELEAKRKQPALEHNEVRDGRGQYELTYRTAEGTQVHEKGRLVSTPDGTAQYLYVEGETTYITPEGETVVTRYTAGLDGTHVEGGHLPVPVKSSAVTLVPQPVPVAAP